jgi:hypothetical protein
MREGTRRCFGGTAITVRHAWTLPVGGLSAPRNDYSAGGDDIFVDAEVIPADERRDTVRRLIALCHVVNELVDLTEAEPAMHDHAIRARSVLRDTIVDLVANGRASRSEAA